jgi:hypothetical protein
MTPKNYRWANLTREEKDKLLTHYEMSLLQRNKDEAIREEHIESLQSFADEVGTPYKTLLRNVQAWKASTLELLGEEAIEDLIRKEYRVPLQMGKGRQFTDYMVIDRDEAIIISDIEIPDENFIALQLAVAEGKLRGIKTLLIIGDFAALDKSAFTHYKKSWNAGNGNPFSDIVARLQAVLDYLADWFDEIYLVEGNHDRRIALATDGELNLGMLINSDKVHYSQYASMYVKTSRLGTVKLVHQQNYSKTPLSMIPDMYGAELGPDYDPADPIGTMQKTGFVLTHTHIAQTGSTPDRVFQAVSLGTMRNPFHTQYKMINQNRHHQWDVAFGVMEDSKIDLVQVPFINWKRRLGDKLYNEVIWKW